MVLIQVGTGLARVGMTRTAPRLCRHIVLLSIRYSMLTVLFVRLSALYNAPAEGGVDMDLTAASTAA